MINRFCIVLFTGIVLLAGCKTSNNFPAVSGTVKKEKVRGNSLIDELRRVPGLRVSGNDSNGTVTVARGSYTIDSNQKPLFVVDGVRIGTSLPQVASVINVSQIDKIRVLKDSEATGQFGTQGANGVILIKMKKSAED